MANSVIWENDPSIIPNQKKKNFFEETPQQEKAPVEEQPISDTTREAPGAVPRQRKSNSMPEEDRYLLGAMADGIAVNGGVLFDCKLNGYDMVGFAINSNTNLDIKQNHYAGLTWDNNSFLQFMTARSINDQQVFIFRKGKAESVYSLIHRGVTLNAMEVLRQLVQLLTEHQSSYAQSEYVPLSFSPYTVYLLNKGDMAPEVKVLPIQIQDNARPCEVPNDAELTVSSDLYSACYLCSEIDSQAFVSENGHVTALDTCGLIQDALSPFPYSRPGLKAFADALELEYIPPVQETHQPKAKVWYTPAPSGSGFFGKARNVMSEFFRDVISDDPGDNDSTWT